MTSDGGSLLLREVDLARGLSCSMSRALCDRRDQTGVHHGQARLLRRRLFTIAMGYEDCNDHKSLRSDPGLKTAVGSPPETGPALASQPTLSRFENRVGSGELRRLSDALIDAYMAARPARQWRLRQSLAGTKPAAATVDTIKLKLLTIGAGWSRV